MRFIRLSEKVRNGITSSPKKHLQTFQVQVDWPNLPTEKGATKRCYQFSSKNWTIPNRYPLGFNISTVKHKNPVGKQLHLFFQFLDGLFCFVFAIFCFPAKTWLSQWSQVKRKFFCFWCLRIFHTSSYLFGLKICELFIFQFVSPQSFDIRRLNSWIYRNGGRSLENKLI